MHPPAPLHAPRPLPLPREPRFWRETMGAGRRGAGVARLLQAGRGPQPLRRAPAGHVHSRNNKKRSKRSLPALRWRRRSALRRHRHAPMHSRNNKNSLRRVQVVEGALALDCSKRVSLSVSLQACLSKRVSHTGYGGRVGPGLRRRARWLDPVPAPGTLVSFCFVFWRECGGPISEQMCV